MEQLRGMGGNAQIIAAKDQDPVGGNQFVIQAVVVPKGERGGVDLRRHRAIEDAAVRLR